MLHRSFKPAKCKIALKLAASRIKLLKNKREAQIKQLKRELAQLLESGQEQTARIRVEHVVREEKTMAAYDLLEIYCELIVARLPMIESQKNCPIDLKEAITSVIFAAPRCADIPELLDARKRFTAKYGKEFVSSAVELRPECGVSRTLVEKLSAKAPDGPTKIKILSTIAEEHNIKWDPNSFGEKDAMPPEDLLNGPNTFEKASKTNVEPITMQALPENVFEHNVRSTPSSQNFSSTDVGASKAMTSGSSNPEVRPSGTRAEGMEFRHSYSGDGNAFPSGRQNWNMEFKDATSAAQAAAESAERASMAARAAAELSSGGKITRQYSKESQKSSAYGLRDERPGKYAGSELHGEHLAKNSVNNSFHDRNARIHNEQIDGHEQDKLAGLAERPYRNSHTKKSSRSDSLKSNTASPDVDTSVNTFQKAGGYSQKSSSGVEAIKPENGDLFAEGGRKKQSSEFEEKFSREMQHGVKPENVDYFGEERFRKQSSGVSSQSHSRTFAEVGREEQSSEFEEEFSSEIQDGVKTENVDYFREERFRKQSSGVSSHSHSHSRSFGDDYVVSNSDHQKFGNDAGEDHLVGMDHIQTDTKQTQSHGDAGVLFDESGSDDDDYRFDLEGEHNRQESNMYFTSPGRKSSTHISTNTDTWSSRQTMNASLGKSIQQSHFSTEGYSPPEFSESLTGSAVPSQPEDLITVTFDESDGPSSESEEEMEKSKLGGTTNPSIFSRKENVYSGNPEPIQSESHWFTGSSYMEETNSGSNRKPWLHSSSDDLDSMEVQPDKNQGTEFNAESQKKSGFGVSSTQQPSLRLAKSRMDSNSAFDEGKPQQSMQSSRRSSLHEVKDNVDATESPDTMKDTGFLSQSSLESGKELNLGMLTGGLRNKGLRRPPYTKSPSNDASSSSKQAAENTFTTIEQSTAAPTVKTSISTGAQKVSTKVDKKSSSRAQATYLDSDSDDSEEELPPETFRSNRDPSDQKAGIKVTNKSSRRPTMFFDSDNDDSEEDLPKPNLTSKGRPVSGISRRTKASPTCSEKSSSSKVTVTSTVSVTSESGSERKPSRMSSATETLPTARSQTRGTGHQESCEQPRSAEKASSKPMPESKISLREESLKSSATIEQPASPLQKVASSGSTESSSRNTPSRESSLNKASHVHPKLPDYDEITAHLESLRLNRK